ncbi:MAG TPA: glucosyl-3-phosphoglycerate synthase [Acidimicrobiia bacterium]|nr:glucosyl-3-phosphoglycerate synthase [Acidimicrobiia bacterium]
MIDPLLTPAPRLRRFEAGEFTAVRLGAAKAGRRVAVCIPAHNEAATVGATVAATIPALRAGLVDEVVVVDDASSDGTAAEAAAAGARVIRRHRAPGKGAAMAAGVAGVDADLFAFLDADVTNVAPHFVTALVGPLLVDPAVMLVKAAYRRPLYGRPGEGGRVTELMARPLLDRWFPDLADIAQPLAGEMAFRREAAEKAGFDAGYAVDIGLLLDVATLYGADAVAEVDLGERVHRNRPLHELGPVAAAVLDAVLRRVGDPEIAARRSGPAPSGKPALITHTPR